MRYRRKRDLVEAIWFDGRNIGELAMFVGLFSDVKGRLLCDFFDIQSLGDGVIQVIFGRTSDERSWSMRGGSWLVKELCDYVIYSDFSFRSVFEEIDDVLLSERYSEPSFSRDRVDDVDIVDESFNLDRI